VFVVAALLALLPNSAPAQLSRQQPVAASNPTHFIVFNKPGPQWEKRGEFVDHARQHRDLYERMAGEGSIIAGGALAGDPLLAMSVFRTDVDRARIRAALEADPLVQAGVTALEYQEWCVDLGRLNNVRPRIAFRGLTERELHEAKMP
jgi:hypothetical protein